MPNELKEKEYLNSSAMFMPNFVTGMGFVRFDKISTDQMNLLNYLTENMKELTEIKEMVKKHPNDYKLGLNIRSKIKNL